ncbi:MAG TPA: hypothetical protein VLA36_15970 [Longimicrobiales bacterium]|nr:hypothetical protein [Longimicrobiales bacterium]
MPRTLIALTAAALTLLPGSLTAQGFAVGGRAGTLGIGAEVALGMGPNLTVRGGMGLLPIERDASGYWDVGNNVDLTLKMPDTWYNVGLDLYLGSSFRVGGGMLFKPDNPTVTATLASSASIELDGVTYDGSDVGEVIGTVDSKSQAPYVIVGFGKHTASGIGLFLDLGLAFLGESPVTLEATKGNAAVINSPAFQNGLRQEEMNLEEDLPTWAREYWPILNLGIKIGIGS